jgi:hypothetical protein
VSRPRSQLGEINVPICCGGVVVNAGDLIVADAEGIVVVPRTGATSVHEHLSARRIRGTCAAPGSRPAVPLETSAHDFWRLSSRLHD